MKLQRLSAGDTIALVTPASPIAAETLAAAKNLLQEEGYKTKLFPHALDSADYLAGTDEDRAKDIQDAFDDPEVKAVLCTRGGYGCARLIPHLNFDRIAASRKMLVGFSDITTLHLALNRRGIPTIHAPMALTLHYSREPWVYESFKRILKGNLEVPEGSPRGTTINHGTAEGKITGGCLCLIADSIGTHEAIDTRDKLLLIEDVDESPHRIDAMLTHLLNSGVAQSAAGFIVGEMTRTDERIDTGIGGRPWRDIVIERLAPLNKPMIIDYPIGHAKNMLSVPMGIRARLDATAGTVSYLEDLCQ